VSVDSLDLVFQESLMTRLNNLTEEDIAVEELMSCGSEICGIIAQIKNGLRLGKVMIGTVFLEQSLLLCSIILFSFGRVIQQQ